MAGRSRASPRQAGPLAAGAVLASTVMCVRLAVLLTAVQSGVLARVGPALAGMTASGLLATVVLARVGARQEPAPDRQPTLENPFRLRSALLFGAIFTATTLLVRASRELLGATGTLLASGLAGLVDADAPSIALARGAQSDAGNQAALGIIIAVSANNLFKSGIAVIQGAGRFRRDVPVALLAMSAAGVAITILVTALL